MSISNDLRNSLASFFKKDVIFLGDNVVRCAIIISNLKIANYPSRNGNYFFFYGTLSYDIDSKCGLEVGFFADSKRTYRDNIGSFNYASEEYFNNSFVSIDFEFLTKEYDRSTDLKGSKYNINEVEI